MAPFRLTELQPLPLVGCASRSASLGAAGESDGRKDDGGRRSCCLYLLLQSFLHQARQRHSFLWPPAEIASTIWQIARRTRTPPRFSVLFSARPAIQRSTRPVLTSGLRIGMPVRDMARIKLNSERMAGKIGAVNPFYDRAYPAVALSSTAWWLSEPSDRFSLAGA